MQRYPMTPQGHAALEAELKQLKSVDRPRITASIAEAREHGDLKENAEYDAAKEAQGYHEAKIAQLEGAVSTARILDMKDIDISKVSILSTVNLTNLGTKKEFTYKLVSEQEANLKEGKISVTSPIGHGLLGKAVGETAEITVPNGILKFKVNKISVV